MKHRYSKIRRPLVFCCSQHCGHSPVFSSLVWASLCHTVPRSHVLYFLLCAYSFACRLADAAFEAQDEAAKLRQRLEEIQAQIQQQRLTEEGEGGEDDGLGLAQGGSKGKGKGKGKDNGSGNGPAESGDSGELEKQPYGEGGSPAAAGEMGEDGDGEGNGKEGEADGAGVSAVELTAERVVQLEIEKWETEQSKREAEKEAQRSIEEAKQAKVALDTAQSKVRRRGKSTEYALFGVVS